MNFNKKLNFTEKSMLFLSLVNFILQFVVNLSRISIIGFDFLFIPLLIVLFAVAIIYLNNDLSFVLILFMLFFIYGNIEQVIGILQVPYNNLTILISKSITLYYLITKILMLLILVFKNHFETKKILLFLLLLVPILIHQSVVFSLYLINVSFFTEFSFIAIFTVFFRNLFISLTAFLANSIIIYLTCFYVYNRIEIYKNKKQLT